MTNDNPITIPVGAGINMPAVKALQEAGINIVVEQPKFDPHGPGTSDRYDIGFTGSTPRRVEHLDPKSKPVLVDGKPLTVDVEGKPVTVTEDMVNHAKKEAAQNILLNSGATINADALPIYELPAKEVMEAMRDKGLITEKEFSAALPIEFKIPKMSEILRDNNFAAPNLDAGTPNPALAQAGNADSKVPLR